MAHDTPDLTHELALAYHDSLPRRFALPHHGAITDRRLASRVRRTYALIAERQRGSADHYGGGGAPVASATAASATLRASTRPVSVGLTEPTVTNRA